MNEKKHAILAFLADHPGVTHQALADAAGCSKPRVGQILAELSSEKLVEKASGPYAGHGKYQATAEGWAVLYPETAI
jgi:DNA-binding MarR family transcriptional regulator